MSLRDLCNKIVPSFAKTPDLPFRYCKDCSKQIEANRSILLNLRWRWKKIWLLIRWNMDLTSPDRVRRCGAAAHTEGGATQILFLNSIYCDAFFIFIFYLFDFFLVPVCLCVCVFICFPWYSGQEYDIFPLALVMSDKSWSRDKSHVPSYLFVHFLVVCFGRSLIAKCASREEMTWGRTLTGNLVLQDK